MPELNFTSRIPIAKGWSEDKKYCVTRSDGTKYLLRISAAERYENRKELFSMLQKVERLGVPMCRPVELGLCEEGVYTLHSWIDGEEAEEVIPTLGEDEQYALGLEASRILKKIHSVPAPAAQEDWYTRFGRKTDVKIQKYKENPHHFEGDDLIIGYIEANRGLLKGRPQCFQHGDYHVGNMMIENKKSIPESAKVENRTVTAGIGAVRAEDKTVTAGIGAVRAEDKTVTAGIGAVRAEDRTATAGIDAVRAEDRTVTAGIGAVRPEDKTVTADVDAAKAENNKLVIIDFDRFDFGDPWEEFNRIVWCAAASPAFASGRLDGYFGGEPPLAFFKLLALYIASNALSSIYWAPQFGQGELDTMLQQAQDILSWYDGMQNPVPSWYHSRISL